MKNYAIQGGQFTEKGNFTAYNSIGERIHIHKAQMASLKWTKNEEVKFPFYAVGEVKQIGQLDENGVPKTDGNGAAVLVPRLTALSVYPTKQALIDAQVDNITLNVEVSTAVAAQAKSAGLTEKAIEALMGASV